MVTAAMSQVIMNGCLAQIWGMINGLQLFMHFPSMNLEPPVVAFVVIDKLLDVFTFDFSWDGQTLDLTLLGDRFRTPANDAIFKDLEGRKA